MLNLAALLEDSVREKPDRVAIVSGEKRMTYAELDAAANQVANLLISRGVRRGDHVALRCPNTVEFPIVHFGALKAGCAVVPLNVLLKRSEIAYHLRDSDAKVLFASGRAGADEVSAAFSDVDGCEHLFVVEDLAELLADQPETFDCVETAPEDTAVILYTSGTTGRPKGAELTHSNLVHNAQVTAGMFGPHEHDVHLIALPLFHVFGLTCQLHTGMLTRATVVLQARFDAGEAFELMQRERVTVFSGVPTMYWALLGHEDSTGALDFGAIARSLRVATSGGSALPVEVLCRFAERFGVQVLEGYGLSETSPVATFNRVDRPAKPGTVGLPVWGVQVKVVDDEWNAVPDGERGEIVIRGHNVMKGYYRRPEATAEVLRNGWFRTGDIGYRDADGYFSVVDRAKEMIIRGGYNVYPRELEEVLMTHPAISLVAVVGVPHPTHGEEIKAFVVPEAGASTSEAELVEWCQANMAAYKYPRLVELRQALPLSATGKILKRELVAAAAERN
ncbi:long-chain fatty acid--CoA ligase [Saccharopolyspora karakumensis]|uniref:Long-chain fatty acid--CoA ligase n=1 Tax=Saccharopolyspora karakumensis TaxID=2530386 RepID=A0A4R5C1F8_9PSEU|nr:long-chain fatty acid--CoA ligase [Saccharopolyspora karakumensis]TDD90614.1 long-chain fatty acid--CoA ligase [Saccharopolyspora karakumensis]